MAACPWVRRASSQAMDGGAISPRPMQKQRKRGKRQSTIIPNRALMRHNVAVDGSGLVGAVAGDGESCRCPVAAGSDGCRVGGGQMGAAGTVVDLAGAVDADPNPG